MNDLTGKRFGRLVVVRRADPDKYPRPYWECKCDCGNTTIVRGNELISGNTKSCGCLSSDLTRERNLKHGKTGTKIYKAYSHMTQKCYNENASGYKTYGAKGIRICDEWLRKPDGFNNFVNWSYKNGYRDEDNDFLTLSRLDTSKDYEPTNCKWIDHSIKGNYFQESKPICPIFNIKTREEYRREN